MPRVRALVKEAGDIAPDAVKGQIESLAKGSIPEMSTGFLGSGKADLSGLWNHNWLSPTETIFPMTAYAMVASGAASSFIPSPDYNAMMAANPYGMNPYGNPFAPGGYYYSGFNALQDINRSGNLPGNGITSYV